MIQQSLADLSLFAWVDRYVATMFLLAMVVWLAIRFGRFPAIAAAALGVAAIDFFYLPPYFSLGPATTEDAVTLVVFSATAMITGGLAVRARGEAMRHRELAEIARRHSAEVTTLLSISERVAAATSPADLVALVEDDLGPMLQLRVLIRHIAPEAADALPADLRESARRAIAVGMGGRAPESGPARESPVLVPIAAPGRVFGLIAVGAADTEPDLDERRIRLLTAAGQQIGAACERMRLAREVAEARVLADTERFRSALLSSISHDFRTPLGSIMGAATSLLSPEATFADDTRRMMLTTIHQSAQRLNRYIRNLLDVTAIESGAVAPAREWVDLAEIVGTAVQSQESVLGLRPVKIRLQPDLPLLYLDFVLIERVLINLLDNAMKFSPPGAAIEIDVVQIEDRVELVLFNQGSDVAPDELARLFDKFYRGSSAKRSTGVGLGLSICRGFMAAHGGTILAERDPARQGMAFRLSFPMTSGGPNKGVADE